MSFKFICSSYTQLNIFFFLSLFTVMGSKILSISISIIIYRLAWYTMRRKFALRSKCKQFFTRIRFRLKIAKHTQIHIIIEKYFLIVRLYVFRSAREDLSIYWTNLRLCIFDSTTFLIFYTLT